MCRKSIWQKAKTYMAVGLAIVMLSQSLEPMQVSAAYSEQMSKMETRKKDSTEEFEAAKQCGEEEKVNWGSEESQETVKVQETEETENTVENQESTEYLETEETPDTVETKETIEAQETEKGHDLAEALETVETQGTEIDVLEEILYAQAASTVTITPSAISATGQAAKDTQETVEIEIYSEEELDALTVTSSNAEVATVTNPAVPTTNAGSPTATTAAIVTYVGYGKATITATIKGKTSGTETSNTCSVKFFPIAENETLTYAFDPEVPSDGLAQGESTYLKLYLASDTTKSNPLDISLFSLDANPTGRVAIDPATGKITSEYEGTTEASVIITARLKNDAKDIARTTAGTLKCKASETGNVEVTPESDFTWDTSGTTILKYKGSSPNVVIPKKAIAIGPTAFMDNTNLVSVDFSKSLVTRITSGGDIESGLLLAMGAFRGCTNLKSITWNTLITDIGDHAFDGCTSLPMLDCPTNLKGIGKRAFSNCTSLSEINFNQKLESIGENAFNRCALGKGTDGTKKLVIPKSVIQVGASAFCGCDYLEAVYFEEANNAKTKLNLAEYVFSACNKLKEVYLPMQLEKVSAFDFNADPALELVYIPSTTTTLNEVTYQDENEKEQYSGNAIMECPKLILYVKAGSKAMEYAKKYGEEYDEEYDSIKDKDKAFRYKKVNGNDVFGMILNQHLIVLNGVEKIVNNQIVFEVPTTTSTLQPTILPDTEDNRKRKVQYTSSNAGAAKVILGADERTATIQATGFGVAEIVAKCETTSDKCNIYVYPMPQATRLNNELDRTDPEYGFEKGMTMNMSIFKDNDQTKKPISPSMFNFSSSDERLATVDANGHIEVKYNGEGKESVTITATLKNDPGKRKTSRIITVIDKQIDKIVFMKGSGDVQNEECVFDAENYNSVKTILLDKNIVASKEIKFELATKCYPVAELGTSPFYKALSWSSSDTRIGKVEVQTGGDNAIITIPKGVDGAFTITAVGQDLKKKKGKVQVYVTDLQPRISETTISLNGKMNTGTTINVVASQKNYISNTGSRKCTINDSRFEVTYSSSANQDGESYQGKLLIKPKNNQEVPVGNYKVILTIPTQNGRSYDYAMTIRVNAKMPQFTIKQNGKFNLFYKDSVLPIQIKANNLTINDVKLDGVNSTFQGTYAAATNTLQISYQTGYANYPSTPDKKITLQIFVAGYINPITKKLTVATQEVKPQLVCNRKTTFFYGEGTGESSGTFSIMEKSTGTLVDAKEDGSINGNVIGISSKTTGYATYQPATRLFRQMDIADGKFSNGKKSVTIKLEVQKDNWIKPILISHKLTISKEAQKPEKTYVNVKLQKSSITLNNCTIDEEKKRSADHVQIPVTMAVGGYEIKDIQIKASETQTLKDKFVLTVKDGSLHIHLTERATKGNYKLPLQYTIISKADAAEKVEPNEKKSTMVLTVKVIDTLPTIKVTMKGKIDCIQLNQGITVTVDGLNDMNYHKEDLGATMELTGNPNATDKFQVTSQSISGGKAYFVIKPKTTVDSNGNLVPAKLYTNKKYTITLGFTFTGPNGAVYQIQKKNVTIQPVQSTIKYKMTGNVIYQCNMDRDAYFTITPSSPAGAVLLTGEITKSGYPSKITEEDIEFTAITQNADGKSLDVHYKLLSGAAFKAGKSYTFKVKVTPLGCAENKSATTVSVSCKVKK